MSCSVSRVSDEARAATIAAWAIPGLCHGFMGRAGGISIGAYATLNLAETVGDDAAALCTNWERWHAAYPGMRVARLRQVHGSTVVTAGADYDGARREGDGIVSAAPGIAAGIFTADCVPILMVDAAARVVGALHAGWRGTIAGIAGEGVRAMAGIGARQYALRAALGPSIGPCCFEVDAELAERFVRTIPHAREYARAGRPGKSYLDLRGIIRGQLERAGLEPDAITSVGPCTRCANETYFSRRGAGGAVTGLQMSFIGFEG
jgi:YfiH family protein